MKKLALARVNYSQFYGVYDSGKTYKERDILIPYHLLVLAKAVEGMDCEVKIFDGELDLLSDSELVTKILEWKPDFVGFTATTPDSVSVKKACMEIKRANTKIETIVGGTHATVLPDYFMDDCIDYVIRGEGECATVDIVNGTCRKGVLSFPNINSMSPDYSKIDFEDYKFTDPLKGRIKAASVMTVYGCPFDCYFCFHSKELRFKKVETFLSEVDYLYNVKGVRYFYVYDDTFLLNIDRVKKILNGLRTFTEAHFQCLTRANLITKEIAQNLKDSNFVRVSMGLESGSDVLLQTIRKGVTVEDGERACRILKNVGIETRGSFILGLPYETKETINETIKFAKRIDLYHANFNIMTPYPGTEVYKMALRNEGIRFCKEEYKTKWDVYKRWGKAIIETNGVSGDDLDKAQVQAQVEFYARGKILYYYDSLFKNGNRSRYFYRPLNFAWKNKFGVNIPFWDSLEESNFVNN